MRNSQMNRCLKGCPRTIMLPIIIFTLATLLRTGSWAGSSPWQRLANGLYLGEFDPKVKSKVCNHRIVILRIDPSLYALKLLSASEHDRKIRTAMQWSIDFGLIAVINAGMYQNMDPLKSTGYMRNYRYLNNPYINPAYGAFLCFNPADASLPQVRIVDRRLQKNWRSVIKGYNTVVQNYRMISGGRKVGWPQRQEIFGTAAIGIDREGNVLFILSPSPYSVHDLIHILISLPIGINNAMYAEGGPQATLFYKANQGERALTGACEGNLIAREGMDLLQPIPDVIGVVKRSVSPLGHPGERKGK